MPKAILFVGEDLELRQDIETHLPAGGGANSWHARFARTGAQALILTEQAHFAAVITELTLPDMNGVDFLDQIMLRQPKAQRIIISSLGDATGTLKCIGGAHHHLYKPCDGATILNALNCGVALEMWLPGGSVQGLMTQMKEVPSPPGIYFQIVSELQSPEPSIQKVVDLISQDPAVTAKVLQLANSAVFGLQLHIVQPGEAISYIGLSSTAALVLFAHTFSFFEHIENAGFSMEALWRHSMWTGHVARQIALQEGTSQEIADQAYVAGLLHDLGKLMLGANVPQSYARVFKIAGEQKARLTEVETAVLGATHAELGACMLGIWGLPRPIVEAVALHHAPKRFAGQGFTPLTAVHAANVIEHQARRDPAIAVPAEVDMHYLRELCLDHRLEDWQINCPKEQIVS
jgi:HD-like signal output (HDOD) protein/ActR/RegA family two-component response regulator